MQVNWRADEKEDTKDHKVQDANAYIVGETLSIEPINLHETDNFLFLFSIKC